MRLNWGEILSSATEMAGAENWTRSRVSFWANIAYREVSARARFEGLEAVAYMSASSGTQRYAYPCDFDYTLSLRIVTSAQTTSGTTCWEPLAKRMPEQVQTNYLSSGVPKYYVEYGGYMELWPSPNSDYPMELRYQAAAETILSENSYPSIDDKWHPAILFKTVELLRGTRGNENAELMARNRYLNYVNSMPTDLALRAQAKQGMAASRPTNINFTP